MSASGWVCDDCGGREFIGLGCSVCGSTSATCYRAIGVVAKRCIPDAPVCEGCEALRAERDALRKAIAEWDASVKAFYAVEDDEFTSEMYARLDAAEDQLRALEAK